LRAENAALATKNSRRLTEADVKVEAGDREAGEHEWLSPEKYAEAVLGRVVDL
jgi:hypothetical protein